METPKCYHLLPISKPDPNQIHLHPPPCRSVLIFLYLFVVLRKQTDIFRHLIIINYIYCLITSAKEVMFSVRFVYLSVSRIAQNLPNQFPWNLVEECTVAWATEHRILMTPVSSMASGLMCSLIGQVMYTLPCQPQQHSPIASVCEFTDREEGRLVYRVLCIVLHCEHEYEQKRKGWFHMSWSICQPSSSLVGSYHVIEGSRLVGGNWQMNKLEEKMGVWGKNLKRRKYVAKERC